MMSTTCRNNNKKMFYQISSLQSKTCQFPVILKENTFDFAILNS